MRIISLLLSLLMGMMAFALPVQAVSFTWEFGREYSGAYAPTGEGPWLTATFDDHNSPGEVSLTLRAVGLTDPEYVNEWLFNFEGNPTALTISPIGATGSFDPPAIRTRQNAFHGAGAGDFDIQFDFANASRERFGAGDVLTVSIMGPGITADMFDAESEMRGRNGRDPFLSVAHVGGIDLPDLPTDVLGKNDDGSGWVTVPDASPLFLLGSACLIGFAVSSKRSAK